MFKFNFLDNEDTTEAETAAGTSENMNWTPWQDVELKDLLNALPPRISYSQITVPSSNITLPRRDLFDVKFQLISQEGNAEDRLDEFVDAPSDLIPSVYEGGLKTWECALDLVAYLDSIGDELTSKSTNLEIGCGTAIPSAFILWKHLNRESKSPLTIHLQDYNLSVLQLVTLPNLILAWHFASSPAIEEGELDFTPELLESFTSALSDAEVTLRFSFGSWDAAPKPSGPYDLVLTSETIYQPTTLPSLLNLLHSACTDASLDVGLYNLRLSEKEGKETKGSCLVAAKVLYFGVGGGTDDFLSRIRQYGGQARIVKRVDDGVGRLVIQLKW